MCATKLLDFMIQRRDSNENVSKKYKVCVISVFIAIIPTHLLS